MRSCAYAVAVRIVIPGPPRGKGRARATRAGHHYTPADTVSYENLIKTLAMQAMNGAEPLTGAVWAHVAMVHPIPESASKKRRAAMLAGEIRPTVKPDMDNTLKVTFDGLNSVVFVDDKQIVELTVFRSYGDTPQVLLTVGPCRPLSYEDLA